MSEINKPVITKEQADALLGLYVEEWSEEDVLEYHVTREWTDQFSPLNDLDTMTIAAALINGYEVEKTPEEKVREYYEKLCDGYDRAQFHEDKGKYLLMKRSVRRTLDALGVQIAGINDEEGDENANDR
ncbi:MULTISPECIES: hypothetical protein [Bacillus]|uniref:hypothetical protein n=1 Tax=Bacillus TaxID=1386 RepID=UPI000BF40B8F|nr:MULTISPECIES: hypothetical protein [Bacillus]MED4547614.1 hypothetical protein [Bacillus licheniformis]